MKKILQLAKHWCLVLLLLACIDFAFAQTNVTGSVMDANENTPLVGVSVVVKGTQRGALTNNDGKFSLQVPDGNAVLVFSYLGYTPQEITVGSQTSLSVSLVPVQTYLDEVVVIGYGTAKKSDLTGAVSTISTKSYENQPLTRMEDAIQGRAAGVTVAKANGQPGSNFKIRIRGVNSITGNNSPLVVVDGVQGIDLSSLNPNDIETIDVLKDASATAIYGVRGIKWGNHGYH